MMLVDIGRLGPEKTKNSYFQRTLFIFILYFGITKGCLHVVSVFVLE